MGSGKADLNENIENGEMVQVVNLGRAVMESLRIIRRMEVGVKLIGEESSEKEFERLGLRRRLEARS